MTAGQPRQPVGTPAGGQFATAARTEPDVTVAPPPSDTGGSGIAPGEVAELLWEQLRKERPIIFLNRVDLPRGQPLWDDWDLHVTAAALDVDDQMRPVLHLELPRQYKTSGLATADGVVLDGETDRLSPCDIEKLDAWLTPHMVRLAAAADVIHRKGYLDRDELERATGSPHIYQV